MIEFIASAAVFGLAGGFGPGPLLTLVVAETLAHGIGAGVRVSLAPVLTDAPIIAVSLLLISKLSSSGWILGAISIAGGVAVMTIGVNDIRRGAERAAETGGAPDSLRRGVIVNFLNPHPYVFWFGVGGPMVVRAAADHTAVAVAFVAVFYGLMVGSKVLIAWITARSRAFLHGRAYDAAIRVLGGLMVVFALLLVRDGVVLIRSGGL